MVERYRRGGSRRKLLGNHQKCWIWGRNVVTETLIAGRWTIHELHLADSLAERELSDLVALAKKRNVQVQVESAEKLKQLCRSGEHQGMIAKMAPFPYHDWVETLDNQPACPLYVVLDSLQDPFNLGAIIRSADVLGATAIILGDQKQVGITSQVARSSAGSVNHLPIVRVPNLSEALLELKDRRVELVAASEKSSTPLDQHDFTVPTAFIIGNEGSGIQADHLQLCNHHVRIPQSGQVGSLNAAVAAGIMFYEVARQRNADSKKQIPG
ncbi:MAG: 23S rRNA (guanosine(2251)-2'-O)-methyltransferase RlmB [Planctomycetaceae bacterium]